MDYLDPLATSPDPASFDMTAAASTPATDASSLGIDPLTGELDPNFLPSMDNLGIDPITGELDPSGGLDPVIPVNAHPSTTPTSTPSTWDKILGVTKIGAGVASIFSGSAFTGTGQTATANKSNALASQNKIATAPKTAGTSNLLVFGAIAAFVVALIFLGGSRN